MKGELVFTFLFPHVHKSVWGSEQNIRADTVAQAKL